MNDKILSVQDISCYGQCSLTVALPILSYFGYETAVLPSAVLSTHTCGFKGYTVRDLTEDMSDVISHWKKEKITFGCVYTGYIGDARQFGIIGEAKKTLLEKGGVFVVDPAMADNGKLYPALDESIVCGMSSLIKTADYALPNVTEACLLTGTYYKENYDEKYIEELLEKLLKAGVKKPVVTGVCCDGKLIGSAGVENGEIITVYGEKQPVSYHGTGDIFSSVAVAGIMNGEPLEKVLRRATDFVTDCIKRTANDKSHCYGVKFEKVLKEGKYL